ncbi:hypothetical protein ES702_00005 [subsurface metagenome]
MKIHILYKFIEGPWGGGNQFLKALRDYFRKVGVYSDTPEIKLSMKGLNLSLSKIMHQLERIKEIILFYPKRMKVVKKISRRSEV